MKNKNDRNSINISYWWFSLLLLSILFLMYSSSFNFDYLMNDELHLIGKKLHPKGEFVNYFFTHGRSLFAVYKSVIYNFAEYSPVKIQSIRFLNFLSLGGIALFLFQFLSRKSRNIYLSFFIILFLFSQPAFQGIIGYSVQLIANSQPSMWLSLCAFYLYFYYLDKFKINNINKFAIDFLVFLIFIMAMQSTQTYAYFAVVPLSFLILAEWKKRQKQILTFLALALGSLIFSTLLYKISLEISPKEGYGLGRSSMAALTSSPVKVLLTTLNPQKYWSSFKIWNYPYPFHNTSPLDEKWKITMAMIVIFVWFTIIIGAIVTEYYKSQKSERSSILSKWICSLICLGFGVFFLMADSPLQVINHRPHMTITFVGVYLFIGAYAIQILASSYKIFNMGITKGVGIFLVVFTAFGAQVNVSKGIVNIKQDQIDFIRTELFNKSPQEYTRIIVILPLSNVCVAEPCDPWFGHAIDEGWHSSRPGRYRYALATLGISPESKEIVFVKKYPEQITEKELIIDWNKYVMARQHYLNNLYEQ